MRVFILITATIATSSAFAAQPDGAIEPALLPATTQKLGFFAGTGYLGSPGASGMAFSTGLRLSIGERFVGGFDVGYGLLGAPSGPEDRWWATPSLGVVIPAGRIRLDVGAGLGLGTASGYRAWSAYTAAPFSPVWHDTVPAAGVHAVAFTSLSRKIDLYLRADVGALLISPGPLGLAGTTWFGLSIGAASWVL